MGMKYGTADKWFGTGILLFTTGAGGLVGAWFTPDLDPLATTLRFVGIALIPIGLVLIIAGFGVWRYNLRQESESTVIIAGSASPDDERRAELTAKRDQLEVELAGLRPYTTGLTATHSLYSFGTRSPAEMEANAAYERARKRETQINAAMRAIDRELLSMIRSGSQDD